MRRICKATSQKLNASLAGVATGLYALGFGLPVFAEVTSDGTTSTVVNQNGSLIEILNGRQEGNNLFHSFRDFSVSNGMEAQFNLNNRSHITTIFSRVTGGNVSHIDGTISIVGNPSASLFLLNPAGIIFGQNAKLQIGGSFVGTTANSIKFSDGTEFSAVNPSSSQLLTMRVPIGLQMGTNSGAIAVQGSGHGLTTSLPILGFLTPTNSPVYGLQVSDNRTLALVGNNINLNGGNLTALGGQIQIGSVASGQVTLQPNLQGWTLGYDTVNQFSPITLSQSASLNVNGAPSGSIYLRGQSVELRDGSILRSTNLSDQDAGQIQIHAQDTLSFMGATLDAKIGSGVIVDTIANGRSANIDVSAQNLIFQQGGGIASRTFGEGKGGKITLAIAESTKFIDFAPANPFLISGLFSLGFAEGKVGDIQVSTGSFKVTNGSAIIINPYSSGDGGSINIHATDLIELTGMSSLFSPSAFSNVNFGTGNTGNLSIHTKRLILSEGGLVTASTVNKGNAGSVNINATESIVVRGQKPGSINSSSINSSGLILDPIQRQIFGLPDAPSGDSGNIIITTPLLEVMDKGEISVRNPGQGNAGVAKINANSILLTNQASISAATNIGEGGNIFVVTDIIRMRGSSITANAGSKGNGGNITINSAIIVGLENSDIIANAVGGRGGNINISTQGIIGLQFRNTLTPREDLTNDITASSEFNVNGSVQINNIGVDPNSGLIELPANVTDTSQQIASGCSANTGSSFVATGGGGIPQNPTQEMRSDRPWSDVRDISAFHTKQQVQAQAPTQPQIPIQATSWHRNAQGKIELITNQSSSQVQPALTCAAVPQN